MIVRDMVFIKEYILYTGYDFLFFVFCFIFFLYRINKSVFVYDIVIGIFI